jgi:hypothetical protein
MSDERVEVSRAIAAEPGAIFALLRDPQGQVSIDAAGMLMSSDGDPVTGVGDSYIVHMDREALGDMPLGLYDAKVVIVAYEPDREIAWTVGATEGPPLGHVYGYRLEPIDGGTLVTQYVDWSGANDDIKKFLTFPVVPEGSLRATLGILARTVAPGEARPGA